MEQPKIIKRIEPLPCPHCGKEILVGVNGMLPGVSKLSTIEEVNSSKIALLERIEEIQFVSEEEKMKILEWVKSDNTLIDSDDVEVIADNIAREQTQKISNNTDEQQQQD